MFGEPVCGWKQSHLRGCENQAWVTTAELCARLGRSQTGTVMTAWRWQKEHSRILPANTAATLSFLLTTHGLSFPAATFFRDGKKKKKSRKNHCFLKTSAKSQCEKVQVTENMRFPENKLVITRTGKQALLPASSLEHPDAVLCWGQAFTGAGAGPSPGPPELVPFAQWTQIECGWMAASLVLAGHWVFQGKECLGPVFPGQTGWRIPVGNRQWQCRHCLLTCREIQGAQEPERRGHLPPEESTWAKA